MFFIRLRLLNPKIYTQNGLKRVFFFQTRSVRNRRMTMAPKIDLMRPRNSINKIVSNQYGISTPDFVFCSLFCGRFSKLITYVIIYFSLNGYKIPYYARIAINHNFYSVQTFDRSLGRRLNTRPAALCSNAFLVIHRIFEH